MLPPLPPSITTGASGAGLISATITASGGSPVCGIQAGVL
jgi:hypothetical protein